MFLSNSMVIVKVNDIVNVEKNLKDIMFMDDNDHFYAMNFFDESNSMGEIQWSNSFRYGKMNMVNFIRKSNYFYLFTSSVQNYKYLGKVLDKLLGSNVTIEVFRLPLNCKYKESLSQEITSVDVDPFFGIKAKLELADNNPILLKIYTNGLITYPITTDKTKVDKLLEISTDIIEKCNQNV
ncbi:hypothetical protein NSA56_09000 [Oceanobacillus caeni]|nr:MULTISPECIES: hypothetical protein [Bacillaceae]PZD85554.1 hypothetical protein DEJ64_09410 [Bacilli bacterium]MBU8790022.1 hypothetical protein [Oceanobacillus caeni]MCR1834535.1 hypothetical protein [Oceanobacillus caeni]PZD87169.1 hypothetical protein DEJ60_09005 [Bacilli bacterium]RCO10735.1 hypothetical protein DTX79_03025 [Bacilli bacterium]